MTRLVSIITTILALGFAASAQKETLPGVWRGRVESVNVTTSEIRLSQMSGKTAETFTGMLAANARVRLLDDTIQDLKISDIPTGMYVRVFYDTKNETVAGQKVKVNRIKGILFLGRDAFDKLRVAMNLAPSTPFQLNLNSSLPSRNPLKLYIFVQPPRSQAALVRRIEKWNTEAAKTYGEIRLVPSFGRG